MSRNPQILYNSVLPLGVAVMQRQYSGHPIENALTPFTYEVARYSVTDRQRSNSITWSSDDQSVFADSVGLLIYGRYFTGTGGSVPIENVDLRGSVVVEGSDNFSSWSNVKIYEALRSGANYFSFDEPVLYQHYRITINLTNEIGGTPERIEVSIANLMLGQRLEFERPIIRTHDPLPLNRVTEYQTNLSGNGQFLGRSISRRGVASSVDIPMMSREFARGPFQEFVEHAQRYPYYFSWNEALYPGDAGYVWTDEDIQTGYSGDGSLMSASWNMRGF